MSKVLQTQEEGLIRRGFPSAALMGALLATVLSLMTQGAGFAAHPTNDAAVVDLRPAFTNWGLPLRLQGGRGTCSVFTMAGALEYALARGQQHGTASSIEFLNWASNSPATGQGTFLIRNSGGRVHDRSLTHAYVSAYVNDAAWIDRSPEGGPTP